jgi:hypothetical protein
MYKKKTYSNKNPLQRCRILLNIKKQKMLVVCAESPEEPCNRTSKIPLEKTKQKMKRVDS